eukprot:scaffold20601_cov21-Tisochrysis_lutea.AAC.4
MDTEYGITKVFIRIWDSDTRNWPALVKKVGHLSETAQKGLSRASLALIRASFDECLTLIPTPDSDTYFLHGPRVALWLGHSAPQLASQRGAAAAAAAAYWKEGAARW